MKPSVADRYPGVRELIDALPALTIGCVAPAASEARSARAVTLSRAEAQLLAVVVGRCPAPNDTAPVYGVLGDVGLESFVSAISLRQLETVGFVEFSMEPQHNGDDYSAVKPTAAGVQWAVAHREEMESRHQTRE